MESLIGAFAPYGFYALVIAVLFWMVIRLQDRVSSVLEKVTGALVELRAAIERCQLMHGGIEGCK